jgi:hypothetical protein
MGGIRKSSWKKGTSPIKAKGVKNKKTILKESLGLTNWNKLVSFIEHEGAEKMVEELQKLTGTSFSIAFQSITEFIKPKLSRKEHISDQGPLTEVNFRDLPADLRKQVLEHIRRNTKPAD